MALAFSNTFTCPNAQIPRRNFSFKRPILQSPPPSVRFPKRVLWNRMVVSASAWAAGDSRPDEELNPYEVLGVDPFAEFKTVKVAYMKKRKEAEREGDKTTAALIEKAYDKLIMGQLRDRNDGQVPEDIKYADKQPIVIVPWGLRFSKSSPKDMKFNFGISALCVSYETLVASSNLWVFGLWLLMNFGMAGRALALSDIVIIQAVLRLKFKLNTEYKPLQFLVFAFVWRIVEKLKAYEPPSTPTYTIYGEDSGAIMRMLKRILRSVILVFGCVGVASLAYTGALNLIEFTGNYIPSFLYNNQELLITLPSAVMLFIMASYYR
ncbi:hypothetical protein Tsubulata_008128 [Turnera subulata]|uniref:J domain-containing protein n=1 Tax=Turnera subulata TaxID=218843 RepID=A0A9Q0FMB9_9ROSI|nr:hypothetical protein Tsubulata_008128 [Turnera subulata]